MEYILRVRSDFPGNPQLIRYADLRSVRLAGIGSAVADEPSAEHFALIRSDASAYAAGHAAIAGPHGFDLKMERRIESDGPKGYAWPTAEVLIVHAGRWRVSLGLAGEAGTADLAPGDVAAMPPNVVRQWRRLDGEVGILFIVQGLQGGAGAELQAKAFDAVAQGAHSGMQDTGCIDYSHGIPRLREAHERADDPVTGGAGLASFRVSTGQLAPCESSGLGASGVAEAGILSSCRTRDGFSPGPIQVTGLHGFNLRWLTLQPGAYIPRHARAESEVFVVQDGMLEVSWPDGEQRLGAGEVLSVPVRLPRALRNPTSRPTLAFVVRGADDPAMPQFDSLPGALAANKLLRSGRT